MRRALAERLSRDLVHRKGAEDPTVTINVEPAFRNPTGVGRYSRALIRELAGQDTITPYLLFHYTPAASIWPGGLPDNFRLQRIKVWRKWLALRQAILQHPPRPALRCAGARLYHDFGPFLCPGIAAQSIATLHDASTVLVPQAYQWHARLLFRRCIDNIKSADCLVTVSEFSRRSISDTLGIPEDRIAVIPNGVDPCFWKQPGRALVAKTLEKCGLDRSYMLWTGVMNRRKNLPVLLRAYRACLDMLQGDVSLVLCGLPGVGYEEVQTEIARLGLGRQVIVLRYLPDEELVALISGAQVYVLPSLEEGFGLTALEAMACGTPVVCSSAGALPEVTGDAALHVAPQDVDGFAGAMLRVLQDSALAQQLRYKGRIRARRYQCSAAARKLRSLYAQFL